jgi:hypothetical protein
LRGMIESHVRQRERKVILLFSTAAGRWWQQLSPTRCRIKVSEVEPTPSTVDINLKLYS